MSALELMDGCLAKLKSEPGLSNRRAGTCNHISVFFLPFVIMNLS